MVSRTATNPVKLANAWQEPHRRSSPESALKPFYFSSWRATRSASPCFFTDLHATPCSVWHAQSPVNKISCRIKLCESHFLTPLSNRLSRKGHWADVQSREHVKAHVLEARRGRWHVHTCFLYHAALLFSLMWIAYTAIGAAKPTYKYLCHTEKFIPNKTEVHQKMYTLKWWTVVERVRLKANIVTRVLVFADTCQQAPWMKRQPQAWNILCLTTVRLQKKYNAICR